VISEELEMLTPKLFSPGPVMVRDNVRQALLHHDICHRGAEFEIMFSETQSHINNLFQADDSYYSVIVSGSGTSANEMVLSSIMKDDDAVLLIRNGEFGDRLREIILKYKIPLVDLPFDWAIYPDLQKIEKLIRTNPNIKVIALVFHETSTGMINPVNEVGNICKVFNKLLFVDSISAAGGQFVDVIGNNIAITTSVGGKCVGAFPGSSFVCARKEIYEQLSADQCKNVYLSLYKHYISAIRTRQTPNTPNVTLFWALNQALRNIEAEGLEKWIGKYIECAAILREGAKKVGLRMLLTDHLSNTVTSVFVPEGVDVNMFLAEMERRGYVLYKGKGSYAKEGMFQIANMGEINQEDCHKFLDELQIALDQFAHLLLTR
jgi:2-aminoethylphosphonate-pyruvate transaminase